MISSSRKPNTKDPDGRFEEIVVRLVPSRFSLKEASARRAQTSETTRSYDALVYTNMKITGLHPPPALYLDQYDHIDNLKLVAMEQVGVRWSRYKEYLESFVEGEKAPYYMRSQLIKTLSSGLENLFSSPFPTHRAVRMWWSSETPELDDLPWELIAYSSRGFNKGNFSFVRGLPGDWAPLVPLKRPKLRLAFIHNPSRTSDALRAALTGLTNIEVEPMTDDLHGALHRAAREKFELLHVVADGSVSLAYEGILELDGKKPERIAPSQLSSMLFGSRVSILALSPVEPPPSTDPQQQAVPATYRAFACLGSSRQILPTIVTPLGPMNKDQEFNFWRNFYQEMSQSLSVEDAMTKGQTSGSPSAVALFLRHRLGREFVREHVTRSRAFTPVAEPTAINADLQVARNLLDDLRAVDSKYADLSDNVTSTPLAEAENARQDHLDDILTSWRDLAEEDKQ